MEQLFAAVAAAAAAWHAFNIKLPGQVWPQMGNDKSCKQN